MTFSLKPWWAGLLLLGLGGGCGEDPQPPLIGDSLVQNGSFESKLEGWWTASEGGSTASTSAEAADVGSYGLVLHKGSLGWGSIVGQETTPHSAGQTFQVRARLKGTAGGERVTFSYHGAGFEVTAETRWRTVQRLVLLPEANEFASAFISLTTNDATVHVDDVSFSPATVERGDADEEEGNLVRNGSFESELGLWEFWSNSEGEGVTSPDARHSGYAGLVLTRGPSEGGTSIKQPLPDPVEAGEEYRFEFHVKGARGGEQVLLCLQVNHEPWDGPCVQVKAYSDWEHISQTLKIDPAYDDERVGAMVSLLTEGSVSVDDVIVVRVKP